MRAPPSWDDSQAAQLSDAYRAKHAITDVQHEVALEELGWSAEQYDEKAEQGEALEVCARHAVRAPLSAN